jgi:hypothetical protein
VFEIRIHIVPPTCIECMGLNLKAVCKLTQFMKRIGSCATPSTLIAHAALAHTWLHIGIQWGRDLLRNL